MSATQIFVGVGCCAVAFCAASVCVCVAFLVRHETRLLSERANNDGAAADADGACIAPSLPESDASGDALVVVLLVAALVTVVLGIPLVVISVASLCSHP